MIKRLDPNYEFDTRELVVVLNEVIDELNETRMLLNVHMEQPLAKESAKREDKLYLTAEGMRAYDGSKWV